MFREAIQLIRVQKLSELESDLNRWMTQRNDTVDQGGKKYAETQICYIQNEINRLYKDGISWKI